MKEKPQKNKKLIFRAIRAPFRGLGWLLFSLSKALLLLRNRIRKWRDLKIDYVILTLEGSLPERAAPRPGFIQRQLPLPLGKAELSLEELNEKMRKISEADNAKGILLIFQGLTAGIASIQNLRRSIERLQSAGKKVIVYTPYLDLRHYYAAAAADRIIVPKGSQFEVLGLHTEVIFLKDALAQIGVELDVVQISPYKTAFDSLQHAHMTPEYKAQLDWLLDDQFQTITAELAIDREMDIDQMKKLIDQGPMFAETALENGLIDNVAYEDQLADILAEHTDDQQLEPADKSEKEPHQKPRALLKTWAQARKQLLEKSRRTTKSLIGVVTLSGLITMGPSRRSPFELPIPLVGGSTAGEQTLSTLLRRVERMGNLNALILHVDSGGGSSLASELIARQVQRIRQNIPVLVYMGNVAASGGYYVSARAQHIMSQKSTLTGSIGVISGRPSTSKLLEKIKANRVTLNRGENAGLYTNLAPMTARERDIFWQSILHTYNQFKEEVAQGRDLPFETLDPICEGRVWTGIQAQERKLVDSHGDFVDAVNKAAEIAGLDSDKRHKVLNLYPEKDNYLLPRSFEAAQEIEYFLSQQWLKSIDGKPMFLMPYHFNFN